MPLFTQAPQQRNVCPPPALVCLSRAPRLKDRLEDFKRCEWEVELEGAKGKYEVLVSYMRRRLAGAGLAWHRFLRVLGTRSSVGRIKPAVEATCSPCHQSTVGAGSSLPHTAAPKIPPFPSPQDSLWSPSPVTYPSTFL